MKLLHLGDLHLGKTLGDYDLIRDQEYILGQIVNIIETQNIDAVLIAGDVYDKAVPSEAATRLLDRFLSDLAEKNISTFMISGNHDSDDRLNFGSSLFTKNRIYISAVFDGTLHKTVLEDQYGAVNIWLLPFVKASQVKHFYPDDKIESYEDAVKAVIEHADPDFSHRNILVAHQFVTGGGKDPVSGGSEGAAVQSVGLVERIGAGVFDGFDYVALGHIHSPQKIERETIRYSGSILKYSLSEALNDKSVPVITLGEKGSVELELIPLRPLRDVRHLRGPLKKLLSEENPFQADDDFIYVTLTDEEIINDAMRIIQQVYPNVVKIDYDNSHTREVEQVDLAEIGNHRSFPELIRDFYLQMYGCEMSEDEMAIMQLAAKEAGIIDETD